jgi:3',5'-cyclic AMP phosphodiesterase CpdA
VVDLKKNGLGSLGAEQLEWLEDDLKAKSDSTPIVLFAHIPLWMVAPEWGWGTVDSAQALSHLSRFGSVTVLNGHILIAIGLVGGERFERLVGLPTLDTDHGQTELAQPVKQDRRHSSRLEYDATTTWRFRQFAGDRVCRRRRLALVNHHAFAVENANMRLVHRDIEASKIVHIGSPLPHPGRS